MDSVIDTIMKMKANAGMLNDPSVGHIARKEVLRLTDVLREQLGSPTPAAPDMCACGHSEKDHRFFDDHSECNKCECENGFMPVS